MSYQCIKEEEEVSRTRGSSVTSSVLVLPQFFMLILFIFLAELAAAILAFLFREHVSTSHFLLGLRPFLLITTG